MSLVSPKLTIAIPTYNRNDKLRRSIEMLIPQLTNEVSIIIFDNGSDTHVSETISDIIDKCSNISVFRNKQNLGVSANIIKCFETCETEWMWLLGDDDPPMPDAVHTILEITGLYQDYCFLNFKSPMTESRTTTFSSVGINDFISKIDDFGNTLMISLGVYNLQNLRSDLRLTYQLSYCLAPHLVYLLSGIASTAKVGFIDKQLIDFKLHTPSQGWSWLSLSLTLPVLYEVPLGLDKKNKHLFAQHIKTHLKPPSIVFSILEQPKHYNLPTYDKRYYLRQAFFRSSLFKFDLLELMSFIYYDIKLVVKNIIMNRKIIRIVQRDERV